MEYLSVNLHTSSWHHQLSLIPVEIEEEFHGIQIIQADVCRERGCGISIDKSN